MSVTTAQLARFKSRPEGLTLIVCDENGKDGERNGPAARVGDEVNDIFKLRRNVHAAVFDTRRLRGEARRVGVHCVSDAAVCKRM